MDNTNLHETKIHGSLTFPYSVYHGRIPDWLHSYPLHWHEGFELIYCESGVLRTTLWGHSYTLCSGDLLVVLPQAVHSIEQAGSEAGEYYNIIFLPSIFMGAEGDPCYEKYVLPFIDGDRTMECFHPAGSDFSQAAASCILSLVAHRRESYSTYELMVKANLFQLLHIMTRHSAPTDGGGGCTHLAYGRLKDALYYVQNCYDQEVSIQEAASRCGFSESYFMKLFKELTGMSFNAYLVDYRLELAAKQISATDYKIIDVAENCGFHNHSYFTRAFCRKYQKTPLAYRKAARAHKNPG